MSRESKYRTKKNGLVRRLGTRSTQALAVVAGNMFPYYYVSEYPRSGGTWLGQMLANYLEIPLPQHSALPSMRSVVVHNHWGYSSKLRRVFYLYRDGRDVCTSMYFFCIRALHQENKGMRNYYRGKLPATAVQDWTAESAWQHMPEFISVWATNPMGCRITWADHVRQWAFDRPHVVTLSYEALRSDCLSTLEAVIPVHSGKTINGPRLSKVIEENSFSKQSGRQPGQADNQSFMRKGIVGDWQNHFTLEAGMVFDQHCGEVLQRLNYVSDRNWFKGLSVENPATGETTDPQQPNDHVVHQDAVQ